MDRLAFNNVRYQDSPHLVDEDTFWGSDISRTDERFQQKPVSTNGNYLYTDENADRFGAPPPSYTQESGQPKGVDPVSNVPIKTFDGPKVPEGKKQVFVDDDFISSFTNGEGIIDEILKDNGGN